jgi:tRNA(fMet)-specific endonuclease VapC
MRYMLDTNIIIYAIRHPDSPLNKKIRKHLGKDLCISVVTYGELEYGVQKSSRPEQNRTAVRAFLAGIRILDFDMPAAEHFGDIIADLEGKRMRIGDRDTMIAAHARSSGCTVVTHNVREFGRVEDLAVEDWLTDV